MKKILKTVLCISASLSMCIPSLADANSALTDKGYQLKQVLIMSRHNVRSPLSGKGSFAEAVTPHQWFNWTAPTGQLSLHGGVAETIMGQYFRKYLEDEKFIPENWVPADGEARFYANSFQRTIATAQYFSSGMLPIANVKIERKMALNAEDPVFLPIPELTPDELQTGINHVNNLCAGKGLSGIGLELADDFKRMEKMLDFKKSAYAKKHNLKAIDREDWHIALKGKHKNIIDSKGVTKDLAGVADTLMMQYYETPTSKSAAWGNDKSKEAWKSVGKILTAKCDVEFKNPPIARVIARNLLKEMDTELNTNGRKFTLLLGHDTNLSTLLAALEAKEYTLPGTVAYQSPIGGKILIEKRLGPDGVTYAAVNMVYASDKQMRDLEPLGLDNPPMIYPLEFKAIQKNADGLYRYDDLISLFRKTYQE